MRSTKATDVPRTSIGGRHELPTGAIAVTMTRGDVHADDADSFALAARAMRVGPRSRFCDAPDRRRSGGRTKDLESAVTRG